MTDDPARRGLAYGLGAYLIWGFLPLYFRLMHGVSAFEIVAQRVIWSLLLIAVLVIAVGRTATVRAALANPKAMRLLLGSATLIAINWLVYVWAVNNGHVLAASLGYFLNPLVNVLFGVALLGERLRPAQVGAVVLAGAGVLVLAIGAATGLWISLTLALSFGSYGLLRKIAPVDALEGLAIETALLAPVGLAYLWWATAHGGIAFGADAWTSAILVFGGVVTAAPLLLFAAAARRLRYATLGLLQYLAPTIQFILAVTVFGEPIGPAHLVCFAYIWAGLAIYAVDGWRARPAIA